MVSDEQSSHVVIFRATPRATLDADYLPTARKLRDKAVADYGCLEFICATRPDGDEIALSFWPDAASIGRWKAGAEHLVAQHQQARWYSAYRIQVARSVRDYTSSPALPRAPSGTS